MGNINVLITGGSRGIGKEIVSLYSEKGYHVFSPTRQELDLSSRESIDHYLNKNSDIYFSILINNAGCNDIHYIEDIADNEIENMINVNLVAPMKLIRGLIPKMKNHSFGRIVNISSIWSIVSKPGRTVYSATKNGIHGITKTLSLELAPYNILVNTVAPGFTMTDLTQKNNSEEEIRLMEQRVPLGRLADPKEIAKAVYFFGNKDNTYITGQHLIVDGGYTIQ